MTRKSLKDRLKKWEGLPRKYRKEWKRLTPQKREGLAQKMGRADNHEL